jgi:hypothetical protein
VLHRHRPHPVIDLHSANQYNERDGYASSANLYMEHFPFLDRLWFGEYFDYDENPDYWLVEVSGIPFGLMGEMLQDGGNPWRGMVYGMTGRMPRVQLNQELWQFWDEYGLPEARMIGYWSAGCPVTADREHVKATVYLGDECVIIAAASWEQSTVDVSFDVDWEAIGKDSEKMQAQVPGIPGFQDDEGTVDLHSVSIEPGRGKLIVLSR